jgi:hypothetical protein
MPAGRPTVYNPENAEIARHCCRLGASNDTLAERFGVSPRTIDSWIATIPEFGDAVRQGRQIADDAVVAALYRRATGLKRKSVTVVEGKGEPVTTTRTDHVPPDLRACMFWLRNRRADEWGEKRASADEQGDDRDLAQRLEEAEERMRRFEAEDRAKAEAARREAEAALRSQAERLQVLK